MDLPSDAGYYLCGPLPFMQAIRSALLDRGVAPRNIQYEVFGPDLWQADLSGSRPWARSDAGRPPAARRRHRARGARGERPRSGTSSWMTTGQRELTDAGCRTGTPWGGVSPVPAASPGVEPA